MFGSSEIAFELYSTAEGRERYGSDCVDTQAKLVGFYLLCTRDTRTTNAMAPQHCWYGIHKPPLAINGHEHKIRRSCF
jgi:hypothetical protein